MQRLPDGVQRFIAIFILKWHGIGLSAISFAYGYRLYINTTALSEQEVYDKISRAVDLRLLGVSFMILGLIKLVGIMSNNRQMRLLGVVSLAVLWSIIGVAFLPTPSTIAVLALGMTWTCFGVAIREDFG